MNRKKLKYICWALSKLCVLTHPFVRVEILLTGRHCNLTMMSYNMDVKYNLDEWYCDDV